jgi:hypothetical protein
VTPATETRPRECRAKLHQRLHLCGQLESIHTQLCNDASFVARFPCIADRTAKSAWIIDFTHSNHPVVVKLANLEAIVADRSRRPSPAQARIAQFKTALSTGSEIRLLHGIFPFGISYDLHLLLLVKMIIRTSGLIGIGGMASFIFFDPYSARPMYPSLQSTTVRLAHHSTPAPAVVILN